MKKNSIFLIILISFLLGNLFLVIIPGEKTDHSTILFDKYSAGKSYIIRTYTEHVPILIDSNSDFETLGFPGNGSISNPYIIQSLNITATGVLSIGIKVTLTTCHFEIKDCIILSDYIGIFIDQIASGTAKITENICISNTGDGGGIGLSNTNGCNITNNECSYFMQGIHLNGGSSNYISGNIINSNYYQGINIRHSDSNIITHNWISDSEQHGLALVYTSSNNIIHHNHFINNSKADDYEIDGTTTGVIISQGYDEGSNNFWYDTEGKYGNHWSDYNGKGDYSIDGPSNSLDIYPLTLTDTDAYPLSTILIIISFTIVSIIGTIRRKNKERGNKQK
ncbi:MAG: hypothetical protein FK734_19985 [Asgard group archaeon]|nr:hypothetical protein [Asgard group archaeon]